MLPKPVPALTEAQWKFVAERLEEPAPAEMQAILKRAIEDAKNIKRE